MRGTGVVAVAWSGAATSRTLAAIAHCKKGHAYMCDKRSMGLWTRTRRPAPVDRPPALRDRALGLIGQGAVLLGLDQVYEVGRGRILQHDDVARQHGLMAVSIEKSWHIFDEWRLQQVVLNPDHWGIGPLGLDRAAVIAGINHFYLYSHFVGTVCFLVWLYLFRRRSFPFVRNVIVLTTALALAIYILFPMMPPRLLGDQMQTPGGYHVVDTLAPLLTARAQKGQFDYNPYAAMPSLHFAWALIVGITLARVGRRRTLQVAGLAYPVAMLVTILVSGNHLLLDAAGSIAVVAVAAGALALAGRWADERRGTVTLMGLPRRLRQGRQPRSRFRPSTGSCARRDWRGVASPRPNPTGRWNNVRAQDVVE